MPPSADLNAALDRSIAALNGRTPNTECDHGGDEFRPLWFDGARWVRRPRRPQDDLETGTGDLLPTQQIGPGWTVFSLSRHTAEGADGIGLSGICVDVTPDDDGAPVYICVAHWRNRIGRLDVPADDIREAVKASPAAITALRRMVFRAMSDKPAGLVVVCDAAWLAGAAVRLGGLVDG